MKLIHRTLEQPTSPIGAVQALLAKRRGDRELIDLSQGVPTYAPAPTIVEWVAEAARRPDTSLYAARSGVPELRKLMAEELSSAYLGTVDERQVLITAGCNQAFCVAVSALATVGDEVILPVPYYFNHDMWLRMDHLVPVHLPVGHHFIPDVESAERAITARTKAMVLVTPGNPTGATIPPAVIGDFARLAARHDIVLILDETYRSFRQSDEPPHDLFGTRDWPDHVISLHSFSKDFALPGYRLGALVGHPDLLVEAGKLLECMAICAPGIAQEAAIAGLRGALDWRRERALETGAKLDRFRSLMADSPGGFELCASGAFFGWVRHPFPESTHNVVRGLVTEQDVAVLPGTLFMPSDERFLRFSIAALKEPQFGELHARLTAFGAARENRHVRGGASPGRR
ncbi:aminotransferase [Streptomyces phyllanthi]|uniref:Aminotransferase n=1 Tax=Streptomyces phyllanthi TaxID=1803180 RepID=A0A5N8W619_9ACTN|nr:aminotransferase [Streptomyces phyllanthi]MPY41788.1 aminotransferase [Streptomyces phyllanthi]